MFRDVAEAFQRIGAVVALALDGRIAQFRAGFDKEHKEHAVHVSQAFKRQLAGINWVCVQVAALVVRHIVKNFVTQKFYAFTECVFEILRDAAGVFLAVFA